MRKLRVTLMLVVCFVAATGGRLAAGAAVPEQIVVAVPNDIVSLDPHAHSDFLTRMRMEGAIEETLVRLGTQGEYEPGLATAWRVVNPTTWEFTIRPGVRFHNGELLTAQTVKFTLERCLNPATKCPRRGMFAEIAEVTAPSDSTVQIVTKHPFAALPTALTYATVVPMRALQADPNALRKAAIGTGPMRFVEWVEGQRLVVERFDGYWGRKPLFKRVVYRPIPDDVARVAALQAGEVDFISNLTPEMAKVIARTPGLQVARRGQRMIYIGLDAFGRTTKALADVRVRQAMNYAVNKDVLIKDILEDNAFVNVGGMFPINPGFDSTLRPYPHDLARARQLLAAAGYPEGFEVTFSFVAGIEGSMKTKEVVESVASDLGKVGIRVRLNQLETAAFWDGYFGKRHSMYVLTWGSTPEAGQQLRTLLHSKARGLYYNNPKADELIDSYFAALDEQKRRSIGRTLHHFVHDDAPFLFLYHQYHLFGMRANFTWIERPAEFITLNELGWQ